MDTAIRLFLEEHLGIARKVTLSASARHESGAAAPSGRMDLVNRDSDLALLDRALSGDVAQLPGLVDRWTPVIQARIVRVLRRYSETADPRVAQEVEDLVQQVFVALFENGAAALRAWQPERGLSLDNWVGLIAEQQILVLLRTRKRNPWTDEPALVEELDRPARRAADGDGGAPGGGRGARRRGPPSRGRTA